VAEIAWPVNSVTSLHVAILGRLDDGPPRRAAELLDGT